MRDQIKDMLRERARQQASGAKALSEWLEGQQMKAGSRVRVGEDRRWGTVVEMPGGELGVELDHEQPAGPNRHQRRAAAKAKKSSR